MKPNGAAQIGREQRDLHAYHDGELRGLRRWLFERRLSRSPRLRAELEALGRVGHWVRELGEAPRRIDVWDDVALRLPAIDAERVEPRGERRPGRAGRWDWRGMDWLAAYSRPLAAAGVAAALALALFLGIMEETGPRKAGIIRWMDTGGRSVMVLEDEGEATIVWLLEALDEGISEGASREAV